MSLEESDLHITNFEHSAIEIKKSIESCILRAGLMCRVFSRGKSISSLKSKIDKTCSNGIAKYTCSGKKIQDAIGIRVVLYFMDDIPIVRDLISRNFEIKKNDSVIDMPRGEEFSVTRYNLICELPEYIKNSLHSELKNQPIDETFEVQIRTVLSEGWHEVEHDLRYKNSSFWKDNNDLSRALNGVVATLETSEWSMRKIFEELSHKHYKNKNWIPMLTLKLRVRVDGNLDLEIKNIFNSNIDIAKSFYRLDRAKVIRIFERCRIPVSLNNAIFIWNHLSVKNQEISNLTPSLIKDKISVK